MCAPSCMQFVQETFVHATCAPFHLPSVGFSSFHRKLSCSKHMYHFNYQVWGFLVFTGNCRLAIVRTISTTKCEAFWKFLCTEHTYHGHPVILGLAQAHPNYECKLNCKILQLTMPYHRDTRSKYTNRTVTEQQSDISIDSLINFTFNLLQRVQVLKADSFTSWSLYTRIVWPHILNFACSMNMVG